MTKREYANKVKDMIEATTDIKVEVKPMIKENREELGILRKDGKICPTFYVDETRDIEEFVKFIIDFKSEIGSCDNLMDYLGNKEELKKRLQYDLINEARNKNLPGIKISLNNGLAIRLRINVEDLVGNGIITLNEEIMKVSGITIDEAYEAAKENMNKKDVVIKDAADMMPFIPNNIMFIVTNKEYLAGAAMILNEGVEDKLSNIMLNEFIVIPSSRHEMIVVDREMLEKTRDIVKIVNSEVLDPIDYLSDDVFEFVNGKLVVA